MYNLYAVSAMIVGLFLMITDMSYHLFGFPKLGKEIYIKVGKRKIHVHHGYIGAAITIAALLLN